MKFVFSVIAGLAVSLVAGIHCQAGVISSYDIDVSLPTPYGGWWHTYDGTTNQIGSGLTYAYSGGSGTLNDGLIGTGPGDTHLFRITDKPTITLHLDQTYSHLSEVRLYSYVGANSIPGGITSVDVTIGSITETIATEGFGTFNALNLQAAHELIRASSGLAAATGSIIQLSNFHTSSSGFFSISEVELTFAATSAATNAAPEPTSLAVWSLGLMGLGFARRRRW